MLDLAELQNRFAARLRARPFYRNMQITDEGLMLGANIALARQAQNGKEALALEGEGPRILAMLGAAFGDGATPHSFERMQRASELWREGEKFLAMCHLSYAHVPPVTTEAQAFALFAADELLKAGMTPRGLMKALGLDPSPLDELAKYNPYHRGPGEGGGQFTTADTAGMGAGRAGGENAGRQYAQADQPPPLKRLHPDSTYESDTEARRSLEYWRKQPNEAILPSLGAEGKEPLTARPDGTIVQGNTRIKVLQERGFDVNTLPRVLYDQGFSIGGHLNIEPAPSGGSGGGGSSRLRILPNED